MVTPASCHEPSRAEDPCAQVSLSQTAAQSEAQDLTRHVPAIHRCLSLLSFASHRPRRAAHTYCPQPLFSSSLFHNRVFIRQSTDLFWSTSPRAAILFEPPSAVDKVARSLLLRVCSSLGFWDPTLFWGPPSSLGTPSPSPLLAPPPPSCVLLIMWEAAGLSAKSTYTCSRGDLAQSWGFKYHDMPASWGSVFTGSRNLTLRMSHHNPRSAPAKRTLPKALPIPAEGKSSFQVLGPRPLQPPFPAHAQDIFPAAAATHSRFSPGSLRQPRALLPASDPVPDTLVSIRQPKPTLKASDGTPSLSKPSSDTAPPPPPPPP